MSKKRRPIKVKASLSPTPLEIKLAELYRWVQQADEARGGVRDYAKRSR